MDHGGWDRRRWPEGTGRDGSVWSSRPEGRGAIASSWPVAPTPTRERERTGRTSTNPERFIYSSDYEPYYRGSYRQRLYRRY